MRGGVAAVLAGWLGVVAGAQAQEPRFDVAAERCLPYRKGVIDRQWQVSAPRSPVQAGQPITVGLREKNADTGYRLRVRARIVGGATPLESKPVTLVDDHFIDVEHPQDFQPKQVLGPGVYTVLWIVADGGGFLACDGFVIR